MSCEAKLSRLQFQDKTNRQPVEGSPLDFCRQREKLSRGGGRRQDLEDLKVLSSWRPQTRTSRWGWGEPHAYPWDLVMKHF